MPVDDPWPDNNSTHPDIAQNQVFQFTASCHKFNGMKPRMLVKPGLFMGRGCAKHPYTADVDERAGLTVQLLDKIRNRCNLNIPIRAGGRRVHNSVDVGGDDTIERTRIGKIGTPCFCAFGQITFTANKRNNLMATIGQLSYEDPSHIAGGTDDQNLH